MTVFTHHIYEYKKGLRNLVLHTLPATQKDAAEGRLRYEGIDYFVRVVTEKKINIFFGNKVCVDIVRSIGDKPLYQYTDEEDFILGTMLGYSRLQQCERFIKRKQACLEMVA